MDYETPAFSVHHFKPIRIIGIKHVNAQKKRSRNRERFFKYYDEHDFLEVSNQSFIAHLQKRQAAAMDHAFTEYLYFQPYPLYDTHDILF
jgi:hypothetical protein